MKKNDDDSLLPEDISKNSLIFYILYTIGVTTIMVALYISTVKHEIFHDFVHHHASVHVYYIMLIGFLSFFIFSIRYAFILKKTTYRLNASLVALQNLQTKEKAQERLSALGELSGGLAHEINNALVPILGLSEVLQRRLASSQNTDVIAYTDVIRDSALHARNIVQNILAFARGQENNIIALAHETITEAIKKAQEMIPDTVFLNVENQIENEDIKILSNETGVSQVIVNIIKNACDAMENQGNITISIIKKMISSEEAIENNLNHCDHVLVHITDTGQGMSHATLEKIFNPFFTTKPNDGGTGLGLSVSYGVMQSLGGTIAVESVIGKGSTFTLYFPVLTSDVYYNNLRARDAHAVIGS